MDKKEKDNFTCEDQKYLTLFEYAKEINSNEFERFARLDSKAGGYITANSILMAILIFILPSFIEIFNGINNEILRFLLFLLLFISFIFIVLGFILSYSVLKIQPMHNMKIDDDMLSFFQSNSLIDINFALARRYQEISKNNYDSNENKAKIMSISFWFNLFAVFASVLLLLIIIINKIQGE